MTETSESLKQLLVEVQKTREIIDDEFKEIRNELKELGQSKIITEYTIKDITRRLVAIEKLQDRISSAVGNSNIKDSFIVQAMKNPVFIIAVIALALIVMVIELQNKDTGGIIKPFIEHYDK